MKKEINRALAQQVAERQLEADLKLDRRELNRKELDLFWLKQLIASIKDFRKKQRKAGLNPVGTVL